ncbi:MAG: DUF1684 domain-containing protein [Ignavibacteriaceae bacterium]
MNTLKFSLLILFAITLFSCSKNYTPEQKKYIAEIEQQRKEKDSYMKNDPDSPFNQDPNAHFQNLKYYDVNPDYVFKSKLYEFKNKDTVKIFGTKGEERKAVRLGYVKINFKQGEKDVNVYKSTSKNGETYYSIWFTDLTTGDETYGVGRYLDFDFNPDSNFIYTIDFNLAYSPYCSYSAKYSCAIPTKEDHIDVAIKAGEKSFH